MRTKILALIPLLAVSAFAQTVQPPPPPPDTTDYKQLSLLIRQQRDAAQQKLDDDELRIAILVDQLKQAQAKAQQENQPKPTAHEKGH